MSGSFIFLRGKNVRKKVEKYLVRVVHFSQRKKRNWQANAIDQKREGFKIPTIIIPTCRDSAIKKFNWNECFFVNFSFISKKCSNKDEYQLIFHSFQRNVYKHDFIDLICRRSKISLACLKIRDAQG